MTTRTGSTLPKTTVLLIASVALLLGSMGGAVAGGLVTSADIKDGTVSSKDVKNETIKSTDLSANAAARVVGYKVTDVSRLADPNEQDISLPLNCGGGRRVLGTSGYWETSNYAVQVFILPNGQGAVAYTSNPNSVDPDRLHLRLVCARVSTTG